MKKWVVSNNEGGVKLVRFLQDKLEGRYSLRRLKRACDVSFCEVNGRFQRFGNAVLNAGDRVAFFEEGMQYLPPAVFAVDDSRVLYEDDHLLVYDKPAGAVSDDEAVWETFRAWRPGLTLVHRLDRYTTGVWLLAKGNDVYEALTDLFRKRKVEKTYLAIVDGVPEHDHGTIENYLGRLRRIQGQSIWGKVKENKGHHAVTKWTTEKKGKGASLLCCHPKTGRTHQIRVHLASIGHPILGDYQYGKGFRCKYRPWRYMLHAQGIALPHPVTGEIFSCQVAPPIDFDDAIGVVMTDV